MSLVYIYNTYYIAVHVVRRY